MLSAWRSDQARPELPEQRADTKKAAATLRVQVTTLGGTPLGRAIVTVSTPGATGPQPATTDNDGRADFTVAPGRWLVSAGHDGYLTLQAGQRRPQDLPRPLRLEAGQSVTIVMRLPRCGVLGGRVLDELGEPVTKARVRALRYGYRRGLRTLLAVGEAESNAAGLYSIAGLGPGVYVLSAMFRKGGSAPATPAGAVAFAPTYYPGTTSLSEVQPIELGLEQELNGHDFRMVPTRPVRIGGVLTDSRGKPAVQGAVSLYRRLGPAEAFAEVLDSTVSMSSNGSFFIAEVAPGEYLLRGMVPRTQTSEEEYGSMVLSVGGGDLTGLTLSAGRGGQVLGRVTGLPRPTDRVWVVGVLADRPDSADMPRALTGYGFSTFTLTGVSGRVLIRVTDLPPGLSLRAVTRGGRDITDAALDLKDGDTVTDVRVALTSQSTEITGTVADDLGRQYFQDYVAVAFPEDRNRWEDPTRYIGVARPDQQGRFSVAGLPAGSYLVAVVNNMEEGEWTNKDLLEQLRRRALSVTLAEGERKDIRLTPPPASGPPHAHDGSPPAPRRLSLPLASRPVRPAAR